MQTQPDQANILYLYDLPKKTFTSIRLAETVRDITGLTLEHQPQVTRDCNRPFYTARIKIDNPDRFAQATNKLRFFEFMGAPCRSLPYQTELLGQNVTRLMPQNVFVRKIPQQYQSKELEEYFSKFG